MVEEGVQSCISSSICEHQWQRSRCKKLVAAASASTSGRGADVNNVVAAASASTSGRGAGVNTGGAAASAAPAEQRGSTYYLTQENQGFSNMYSQSLGSHVQKIL